MSAEANKLTMDKKFPTKLTKLEGHFADRPDVLYADTVYFADDDEDNAVTYWINKKGEWVSAGGDGITKLLPFEADYDYLENEIIREAGELKYANADFTSGAAYDALNWDSLAGAPAAKIESPDTNVSLAATNTGLELAGSTETSKITASSGFILSAPTIQLKDENGNFRIRVGSSYSRLISPDQASIINVQNNQIQLKNSEIVLNDASSHERIKITTASSSMNSTDGTATVSVRNGLSSIAVDTRDSATIRKNQFRVTTSGTTRFYADTNQSVLQAPDTANGVVCVAEGTYVKGNALHPLTDNGTTLGSWNKRWSKVYAASSTISTSDGRLKRNIQDLTANELKAFSKLRPVTFDRIDDDVEQKTVGFIAQEVEATFAEYGIDADEYFFLDHKWKEEKEGDVMLGIEGQEKGSNLYDKYGIDDVYGIAYSEFIALNLAYSQSLEKRLEAIEAKLGL